MTAVVTNIQNLTGCNSDDGLIYINISGGEPPYTYEIEFEEYGTGIISTQIIESIDGIVEEDSLAQGNYTIYITDIHNCEPYTINETLEANNPPNVDLTAINGPTWVEGDNGFIEIELSQGTSPYNYFWTGPNGFTSTCLLYTSDAADE